jgi:hypothetical protein
MTFRMWRNMLKNDRESYVYEILIIFTVEACEFGNDNLLNDETIVFIS